MDENTTGDGVIEEHWPFDGPHDWWATKQAGIALANLVRYLNNATGPGHQVSALPYAATANSVILSLRSVAGLLPQLLEQLAEFLGQQASDPTLYDDRRGGPDAPAASLVASIAAEHLDTASQQARKLEGVLRLAAQHTNHLGNDDPPATPEPASPQQPVDGEPTSVQRGRWYPGPAPTLPGETSGQYTNRLTGADKTGREPYDHKRFRQCSIGYHTECSCRADYPLGAATGCECPCHTDTAPPNAVLTMAETEAAKTLASLYDLPKVTGYRVIVEALAAIEAGAASIAELRVPLEASYNTTLGDDILIDVADVLGFYERWKTSEIHSAVGGEDLG